MTRIKICGLSAPDALDAAVDAGADMAGFVFFAASPRHLSFESARRLGQRAGGRIEKVALTVNADDATLDAIIDTLRPDLIQLHGSEPPARAAEIRHRTGRRVMKAVGVAGIGDLERARGYRDSVDLILFDAKPAPDARLPGGNGRAFDWTVLRGVDPGPPWMLSGGLDANNVAEAMGVTSAAALDVSSGVETAPGVKGPDLIRAFVAAVRASVV